MACPGRRQCGEGGTSEPTRETGAVTEELHQQAKAEKDAGFS